MWKHGKRFSTLLLAISFLSSNIETLAIEKQNTKNWANNYEEKYTKLPNRAPPAIGVRSLSDAGLWEYNQTFEELKEQSKYLPANAFIEIFSPTNTQNMTQLVTDVEPINSTNKEVILNKNTGIPILDEFEQEEYFGLSDTKINYLIQNNIVSRIPQTITIKENNIHIDDLAPLYNVKENEPEQKSNFLMLLHKATFGVIPSRPLVYNVTPYRLAKKVYWRILREDSINPTRITGYEKIVDPKAKQYNVMDKSMHDGENYLDRGEYQVQLLNGDGTVDQHASIVRYPNLDKLFITNPNVKELYIRSLFEKGIIYYKNLYPDYSSRNKVIGKNQTQYTSYGKQDTAGNLLFPAWAPELGARDNGVNLAHTSAITIQSADIWGEEFLVDDKGISYNQKNFFNDESMTTMEALKAIEAILRQTEGDMSDIEASLVSYKYGADFTKMISPADHRTVMYLTAKGIMDFENFEEYSFLYTPLTKKYAYTLVYRIHNKAARKAFTQIQLTDAEAFWVDQGFVGGSIEVKKLELENVRNLVDESGELTYRPGNNSIIKSTDKVKVSLEPTIEETLTRAYGGNYTTALAEVETKETPFRNEATAIPDTEMKRYIIIEELPNAYEYTYKKRDIAGGTMPQSRANMSLAKKAINASKDIISVKYKELTDNFEVIFYVEAANLSSAINQVRANLAFKLDSIAMSELLNVVVKYLPKGKEIALIPETDFQKLDSELTLISENVIINNKTNVKAILLPDQSLAIVGNEIIKAETLYIKSPKDNLTYYNLDILKSLMSNGYLSTFSNHALYTREEIGEEYADIHSSRGDYLSKIMVRMFSHLTNETYSDIDEVTLGVKRQDNLFVNILQLQSMSNSYVKEFTESTVDGVPITIKFLLDFKLYIPPNAETIPDNKVATVKDLNTFLFSRPPDSDKELQDYWDMNIMLSNALMNGLLETKGIEYINTGYLIPNITILYYSNKLNTIIENETIYDYANMREVVSKFLQKVGEEFTEDFVKKYLGSLELYNKRMTLNEGITSELFSSNVDIIKNEDRRIIGWLPKYNNHSEYFPKKVLSVDHYPMWVHALFNNVAQTEDLTTELNNTNLWRMIAYGRSFNALPVKENQRDAKIFSSSTATYALPANNAVYTQVTNTSLQWQNNKLILPTRESLASVNSNLIGTEVEFDGRKFYLKDLDSNYYVLIETTPTEITTKQLDMGINDAYTNHVQLFDKGVGKYKSLDNTLPLEYYKDSKNILIVTDKGKVMNQYESGEFIESKDPKKVRETFVSYFPLVRLNALYYNLENGVLVRADSPISALVEDLFTGILTRTYIDNLILESSGSTDLEKIEIGSTIELGDILLEKIADDEYVTAPIRITSTLTAPTVRNSIINKDSLATFTATSLNFPVRHENEIISFVDYIDEVTIAEPLLNNKFNYNNTIVSSKKGSFKAYKTNDGNTVELIKMEDIPQSISLRLRISSGLSVIKTDLDSQYRLIFSAVKKGESKLGNAALITPSALLETEMESVDSLSTPKFLALPNSEGIFSQFISEHKKLQAQQASVIVLAVLAIVIFLRMFFTAYFKTMSSVQLFMYVNYALVPKETKKGFDWIKFLTIGELDCNMNKSWAQLVPTLILEMVLMAVVFSIIRLILQVQI